MPTLLRALCTVVVRILGTLAVFFGLLGLALDGYAEDAGMETPPTWPRAFGFLALAAALFVGGDLLARTKTDPPISAVVVFLSA